MAEILKWTVPGPAEQRQIIECLEIEEESVHVYAVSKTWYEAWKFYVGLTEQATRDDVKPQVNTYNIVKLKQFVHITIFFGILII